LRPKIILSTIIGIQILFNSMRCGESIEDPDPPMRPVWVEKSVLLAINETGIRPYAEGDGILLEWHPNSENDLAGYKLYRASNDIKNKFEKIADINAFTVGGADTFYIDDLINFNTDYFYYLKAYDQADNLSLPTDTLRYRLIPKVNPTLPSGTISNLQPTFEWYDFSSATFQYVIRVETFLSREVIWISQFTKPNYTDFLQRIAYNNDETAKIPSLESGITYQWCVKAISLIDNYNLDIGGSLSNWAYFSIE
jgi:hypothetical protein